MLCILLQVISLILSNLPHNLYTEVSGGLTTSDSSTAQQAVEILRMYNIIDKVLYTFFTFYM